MRCNPPPFTAIYAILDAIGFNQFTLTVSNPVRTLFSANWSFRFHYGVFFAIVIHGAGTPSGWGTGSSWRHSLAARRQGFVKKEGNAEKRLNRLLNKNSTNTETCMQKRGKAVADPGPKGKAAKKLKLRRTQPLGQAEF